MLVMLLLCQAVDARAGKRNVPKAAAKAGKCEPVLVRNQADALHLETHTRLAAAISEMKRKGLRPRLTTTFRSRAEQSNLFRCAAQKNCRTRRGVYDAARPGSSLHEAGLAVDLAGVANGVRRQRRLTRDGGKMVRIMRKHGFDWRYGMHDPVHFEINPARAGFPSDKAAIQAGQQRWEKQGRAARAAGCRVPRQKEKNARAVVFTPRPAHKETLKMR
ncbi:MAG: D-alanyl-D-alanine carboxypeptidase family protein [Blastocatellia bacterium]